MKYSISCCLEESSRHLTSPSFTKEPNDSPTNRSRPADTHTSSLPLFCPASLLLAMIISLLFYLSSAQTPSHLPQELVHGEEAIPSTISGKNGHCSSLFQPSQKVPKAEVSPCCAHTHSVVLFRFSAGEKTAVSPEDLPSQSEQGGLMGDSGKGPGVLMISDTQTPKTQARPLDLLHPHD